MTDLDIAYMNISYVFLPFHFINEICYENCSPTVFQGGGGLSLYYRDELTTHEHRPLVPDNFKYIENERQWLLVDNENTKLAFLRYSCPTAFQYIVTG